VTNSYIELHYILGVRVKVLHSLGDSLLRIQLKGSTFFARVIKWSLKRLIHDRLRHKYTTYTASDICVF